MKQKITLVLAFISCWYSFSQTVGATFASSGINYVVTKATFPYEVAVGSNTGFVGAATIPATVSNAGKSFAVTAIADYAFYACELMTSVSMPNTIITIGGHCFENCHSLTSVTIPESVTSTGEVAFLGCYNLTSVSIPNSITAINNGVFGGCSGLTTIALPETLKTIGDDAFSACTGLTTITIPNSVTGIAYRAFNYCSGLTSLTLSNALTSVEFGTFANCSNLSTVIVPNSVTSILASAFANCVSLTSVSLPDSITEIVGSAFANCTALTNVSVSWATPLVITNDVFSGVTLSNVQLNVPAGTIALYDATSVWTDFNPTLSPPVVGQSFAANGINYIVTKATSPYEVAVGSNTSFVGVATIPATVMNSGNEFNVTAIGQSAFNGCAGLTSVVIPNSVLTINDRAFYTCSNLSNVVVPNALTTIGKYAFLGCSNLVRIAIPETVTSIGDWAFSDCHKLATVNIPNTITVLNTGVFSGCLDLSTITLPTNLSSIGAHSFEGCSGLSTISLPSTITDIMTNAFANCTGLTAFTVNWTTPLVITTDVFSGVNLLNVQLNVPPGTIVVYDEAAVWQDFNPTLSPPVVGQSFAANGINYIVTKATLPYEVAVGNNAGFSGDAVVPATVFDSGNEFNVTAIGESAFHGCTELTSVSIPNSVITIDRQAFYDCYSLASVTIPNSVVGIGHAAFGYNFNLTSLTLGSGLTNIGVSAFYGCNMLTEVTIPNAVTTIGNEAFRDCTAITSLNITSSVSSFGNNVFTNCTSLNTVTVGWTTPLAIDTTIFEFVNLAEVKLNIPVGTKAAYLAAAVWNEFNPIAEPITNTFNFCKGAKPNPLASPFATGSALSWYTVATGGRALAAAPTPTTTTVGTKLYYVSEVVAGVESARQTITVNTIALPATPTTIMGIASQGALVGMDTTATYSISPVDGAVNYTWTAPTGVNIVDGQGTNTIIVNFADVPLGAGAIGNLSVVAINSNDCNSLPRTLALTKALPKAPAAVRMTDASLPIPISGIPTAVTSFAQYMGTTKAVTLTATEVEGASSYEWELPAGVTQLSGGTTNVIMVNFAGVTSGSTHNFTTSKGVSTNILRIGAKAVNGTGASVTANTALVEPTTTSTAKLLTLRATVPTAPSAIKLTDDAALDPLKAVTVITTFLGTNKVLKLTATASALSSSYSWELPSGVNQLSGANTNVITVDFKDVASGTTNLFIGVKAINGIGSSVTTNLAPNAASTARLLKLTATVPATVTAVTGQIAALCGGSTYSYTITPTALATAYTITAPTGAVVQSATRMSNSSNVLTTADLVFTVQYPSGFVANAASPQTLAVASENRVGRSLTNRVLTLSTAMPSIGTLTGSAGIANFRRTGTQTFTAPAVLGATTYTWTVANGATIVSGQGMATVTVNFAAVPTTTASTKVSVVATNACGASTAIKSISLRSAAAREAAIETLTVNTTEVYPNPVSSVFNVDVTASKAGILAITIYSLDGIVVINTKTIGLNAGANTISENVSSLKKGIYVLQLVNTKNNEVITKKLIKN